MDHNWNFDDHRTFGSPEFPTSPFTFYGSHHTQGQPQVQLGAQFPGGPYGQHREYPPVHQGHFQADSLNHLHIPSQTATFQNTPIGHDTTIHTPNTSAQDLAQPASSQIFAQHASNEVPVQPVPAGKGKGRKSTEYSARELFDIVQTAIKVKIFAAKYGQKGAKDKEFGNMVRGLGIKGSDGILKSRLQDLLVFHEVHHIFW
jgi:hypothetical protein